MQKIEILQRILLELEAETAFALVLNSTKSYPRFLEVISKDEYNLVEVGLPIKKLTEVLRIMLPDRSPTKDRKVDNYLLRLHSLKECKKCSSIKPIQEFRLNKSRSDGYNAYCKVCQSKETSRSQPARQAKYKASGIARVVGWSDLEKISAFYAGCPEGYHVDHIVPLQGINVSGLHVLNNLQYLTAEDNIRKNNKFAE